MLDDVSQSYRDLVRIVLTEQISEAIKAGTCEVFIGFQEVTVDDSSEYDESLIRPFVHIRQVNNQ